MGYARAGFEVFGVDIKRSRRYPFSFTQGDALEVLNDLIQSGEIEEYAGIHASPPCQDASITRRIHQDLIGTYPQLIAPTRELLRKSGKPYIMENVPGAALEFPIQLCGSSFGLKVIRHRLFESNLMLFGLPCGKHGPTGSSRGYSKGFEFVTVGGHNYDLAQGKKAMGIDWMTKDELSQAIPPAYTEFIGHQLLTVIERQRAA